MLFQHLLACLSFCPQPVASASSYAVAVPLPCPPPCPHRLAPLPEFHRPVRQSPPAAQSGEWRTMMYHWQSRDHLLDLHRPRSRSHDPTTPPDRPTPQVWMMMQTPGPVLPSHSPHVPIRRQSSASPPVADPCPSRPAVHSNRLEPRQPNADVHQAAPLPTRTPCADLR